MSICSNILFLRILYLVQVSLQVIRFVIPIGLIIKISIDMYKNMIIKDESKRKENANIAIRRIVASVIVFLVPTMVNLVMSLIENTTGQTYDYKGCLSDIENINYYIELSNKEEELKELEDKEKALNEYEKCKQEALELVKNNLSRNKPPTSSSGGSTTTVSSTSIGKKYNLSNSELSDIAKICYKEQGTPTGAAWEASLMANRYELYGASYGSLYNYVMKCRWWAPANSGSYKSVNLSDSVLNAVKQVLVNGQRPISLYVDEHDWTGDLKKLSNNGKDIYNFNNKSNYKPNVTIIYNKYGAVYTYYGHANDSSDPFGYTDNAKKIVSSLNSRS